MKSYVKWSLLLLFDHLLAVVASALIFGFLGAWGFGAVTVICVVLSLCCAFLIPYHDSWKIGVADGNVLKREGGSASVARGVLAGALATIPSFFVALISFLCSVNGLAIETLMGQSIAEVVYRAWFLPFTPIFPHLVRFPWLYFVPLVTAPLASGIGYFFGRNKLMLRDYLYYRREKDTTK